MADFNSKFNVEDLVNSLKEIEQSTPEFAEVPVGKYECQIVKMELGETKAKSPACKIQFKIVEGEFKNQCLFYTRPLITADKETGKMTNAFGLHMNNQFLKSLDSGNDIKFENFNQYATLLSAVFNEIKSLSYLVEYTRTNDFPNYKIKEIYED